MNLKYNTFLLESVISELILESKLEILANLENILYELKLSNDNSIRKIADTLLDIAKSNKDLKLVQNFINIDSDPTKVSFIPDNRVKYDDDYSIVALKTNNKGILSNVVASGHEIIIKSGIPLKGLIQTHHIDELPSNRWNLLGIYKGEDADISYSKYTLYHLQNVDDPKVYIVSFSSYSHGAAFTSIPYTPENLRGSIKIGRFVNKILDLYYEDDKEKRLNYTSSDVEKFVNAYSALIIYRRNASKYFEIVSGEKIKYWYYKDNYSSSTGQLGSSCMRYDDCQNYFNIYIENPDVCQLLIFKNVTGDKINGRALLWIDVDGKKCMDRIYTTKDNYNILFLKWAKENGYEYIYRSEINIKVKIKNKDYNKYPYLDTLFFLKFSRHIDDLTEDDLDKEAFLTNKKPDRPFIVLQETNGNYNERN
jgi:hypothetical protein